MKAMLFAATATATAVATLLAACSDSAGPGAKGATTDAGAGADDASGSFTQGVEVIVPVPATGRAFVSLATDAVVTPADPSTDKSWDMAFEGLDAFTNSGPSGPGAAEAFGPLDPVAFLDDTVPSTPFMTADLTGGAFIRWYFYDGADNHTLDSRFHVYGIKDGDKTYKVQILSYYGTRNNAPVSALYHIRYAEVTAAGSGAVQDVADLDGTAGGVGATGDQPGDCIDLGTGARAMLTEAQASTSSAWHLCFRRDNISVNGDKGGPRGAGAIDFDAAKTPTETLPAVQALTPDNTKAEFDATDASKFAGQTFRGDSVVSAFSGLWIVSGSNPPAPLQQAWLVLGADGKTSYLVGFEKFDGATATALGTVYMRVKPVH